MKLPILYCCLAVAAFALLSSCYRDVVSPGADPNGPPQQVSFSGDVLPILNSKCATSGCHDGVPSHKPALTAEKAYGSLVNGGYVNLMLPSQSSIYLVIKGGSMPPTGPLKSSDVQKVYDWIRTGAANN
ncbi:MAG TPA: hypothetical protein VF145_04575 [Chitinophagaceae bacterium]